MMTKILTVLGARPQFIKAAVVSRAFSKYKSSINEIIIHTGQHYDANMSEVFFDELNIPRPSYNLGVGGGSHGANTGRMLEKLESLMQSEHPDLVMVYGDTDSTLAGALSAVKLHIPVVHVEAGLRSFNRKMPEEINRVLTDHIASILLAPTDSARNNLFNEGIAVSSTHVIGDVMYDAALYYKSKASKPIWFDELGIAPGAFVLSTVHRAENTDDRKRMESILYGLSDAGSLVILPLHPRTRKKIEEMNLDIPENVRVVEPVSYLEMVWLEVNCKLIATDSGGVQKEAYFHGKPCVTLREETEWVELVECGANRLVGTDAKLIAEAIHEMPAYIETKQFYGQGNSGELIANLIMSLKNNRN
jgi:UDP-GlcNAc3NAcA epimerase